MPLLRTRLRGPVCASSRRECDGSVSRPSHSLAVRLVAALILLPASGAATQLSVAGAVDLSVPENPGQETTAEVCLFPLVPARRTGSSPEALEESEAVACDTVRDSRFRLQAPELGMWRVGFRASGYVPQVLLLEPLAEAADLPPLAATVDVGLEVRVVGPGGEPVPGAHVRARSLPIDEGTGVWLPTMRAAAAGPDGRAVVPRGAGELLEVESFAPGFAPSVALLADPAAPSVAVKLRAAEERTLVVVDEKRAPRPSALLLGGRLGWPLEPTAADGSALVPVPSDGAMELRLLGTDGSRTDTMLAQPSVERPFGEEGPLSVVLPRARSAHGTVVDAQTGRALRGVLVWLLDEPALATRTGIDGDYTLPVPAAATALSALLPGFVSATRNIPSGEGGQVAIAAIALQAEGGIAGTVTSPSGRALGGVRVVLRALGSTMEAGSARARIDRDEESVASTDTRGRFSFEGLAAGIEYRLHLEGKGLAPADVTTKATRSSSDQLTVVLRAGRSVEGSVVDELAAGVEGAVVTLSDATASSEVSTPAGFGAHQVPPALRSRTDSGGSFTIVGVPDGLYDLEVEATGYARLRVSGVEVPSGYDVFYLDEVELASGEGWEGEVVDRGGIGVADARIAVFASADTVSNSGSLLAETTSGAHGRFVLKGLRAGERIVVQVQADGYAMRLLEGVAVDPEEPLTVSLEAAASVAGRVLTEDGAPAAGALVTGSRQPSAAAPDGQARALRERPSAVTDDEGSFVLEGLTEGEYLLRAKAAGFAPSDEQRVSAFGTGQVSYVELVVRSGATLEGQVFDAETGETVADARLTASLNDPTAAFRGTVSTTDAAGHYALRGLQPGRQAVTVTRTGYRSATRLLSVEVGASSLDLALDPGCEITGWVEDTSGALVRAARVSASRIDPRTDLAGQTTGVSTGPDGAFRIGGLAPGTYRVAARKGGFASEAPVVLDVSRGTASGVEVVMSAAASVSGRIVGLEPRDASRIRVAATMPGHPTVEGSVDWRGGYRVGGLASGSWRILAYDPISGRSFRREVALGAEEILDGIDLELASGDPQPGQAARGGRTATKSQ